MAQVIGKEALRRKFRALPAAVKAEVRKVVPESAAELVGMMRRLAPSRTGMLVGSIRAEQTDEFAASVVAGGTAATRREVRKDSGMFTDEAILAEFGVKPHKLGGLFEGAMHPGTPPRPFFYPSWRAMKKPIKSRIARSITKGIKKVARGGA